METPEQRATRFAGDWYERPDFARDVETLAAMLTHAMCEVAHTADEKARAQMACGVDATVTTKHTFGPSERAAQERREETESEKISRGHAECAESTRLFLSGEILGPYSQFASPQTQGSAARLLKHHERR